MSADISPIQVVTDALQNIQSENAELRESLDDVRARLAFEDRGWSLIGAHLTGDKVEGLSLEDVKGISEKARPRVVAASLDKRALDLHTGYVFAKGVSFEGTERATGKAGAPSGLVRFYENAINQAELFSDEAKAALQATRFTDGNVLALCDTSAKTVRIIPLGQIDDVMVSDEFPGEVLAYRRTWTPSGARKDKSEWIYTTRHQGPVPASYGKGPEQTPVRKNARIVDLRANRQSGWALGVPDAVAGMLWTEAYGQVLQYGQIVNESLSKIIFKVVSKTSAGAKAAGVKIAGANDFGGAASMVEGQDIQMVNSSMRSFDFSAARPLAAMAASAWNVSNMDLLSDSSAAGSSYGSAQALTDGIRNSMLAMQKQWGRFFQDIFYEMGFGRVGVHWEPLDAPDPYRKAQEIKLLSPALSDEEYRAAVLDQLDIVGDPSQIPPSLAARSAEPEGVGAGNSAGVQAASPDQGRSNGTGGADSSSLNDQRTDAVGEALKAIQLDRLEELVVRLENARAEK